MTTWCLQNLNLDLVFHILFVLKRWFLFSLDPLPLLLSELQQNVPWRTLSHTVSSDDSHQAVFLLKWSSGIWKKRSVTLDSLWQTIKPVWTQHCHYRNHSLFSTHWYPQVCSACRVKVSWSINLVNILAVLWIYTCVNNLHAGKSSVMSLSGIMVTLTDENRLQFIYNLHVTKHIF